MASNDEMNVRIRDALYGRRSPAPRSTDAKAKEDEGSGDPREQARGIGGQADAGGGQTPYMPRNMNDDLKEVFNAQKRRKGMW